MRWLISSWLLVSLWLAGVSANAAPEAGKVLKVLPQYLDLKGRASLSPSLYDRDTYQAQLRNHPDQRSGIVFHVRWRADKELTMRIEARGVIRGKTPSLVTVDQPVTKHGGFGNWTKTVISGDDFKQLESLTAWRVSLWDGGELVSEYKSFLW
jgi:hypothetical protein